MPPQALPLLQVILLCLLQTLRPCNVPSQIITATFGATVKPTTLKLQVTMTLGPLNLKTTMEPLKPITTVLVHMVNHTINKAILLEILHNPVLNNTLTHTSMIYTNSKIQNKKAHRTITLLQQVLQEPILFLKSTAPVSFPTTNALTRSISTSIAIFNC